MGTCPVEIRRSRGLTQQQVAERMGVTKGRISQIEQGKISGHDTLAR
ncbi:helix-turn-helix domain-containing protein [Planotetraspora sp. A-T 1434]|nr:helix-turn-helix transcriptional regulator [Planotetraspora sp. A-T 1434]MCT9929929.1 helix-turn-helix domain-containing protein [Planotetraspora sp. A-T 1434]